MKSIFFIGCFSFLILVSCAIGTDTKTTKPNNGSEILCASKIELKYAKKFSIFESEQGYIIDAFGDDSNELISRYYLVRDESTITPNDGEKILIPISRLASNTSTVFEFVKLLDCLPAIKVTCAPEYIYSPEIIHLIEEGTIRSMGTSYNLNREIVLSAAPDLLLLSDFSDAPKGISLPTLYSFEWKEENLLARAEWIKLWGALFDKFSQADSLFKDMENKYLKLKVLVDNEIRVKPTLFAGGSYSGTWYLTGGKGFMAGVYADAGANFLMADTSIATVSCGLEWMLSEFSQADFWLNCGDLSMEKWDNRLLHLKSVQNGNVYHFQKRSKSVNGVGISDFYESAVAHPDVILADVISILHPQLLPDYERVYADKCEGEIR